MAYAVTGGLTFTYGGLKINARCQVLNKLDRPIAGLYAAGELTGGFFYYNYPSGSGLMRGAVTGRTAMCSRLNEQVRRNFWREMLERSQLRFWPRLRKSSKPMSCDILVITEHWKGRVDAITYQMLAKGRQLADSMGVGLAAVVMGHQLGVVVEALKVKGMDTLLIIDDPALEQAGAEVQAHVIADAALRIDPSLVLIGYSLVGMEMAPAIATRLGVPAMTNCVNVEILGGELVVTRPLFDGTVHAKIVLEGRGPALVAIQRGATPMVQLPAKAASVQAVTVDVQAIPTRSKVLEVIEESVSEVDIAKAEVLVAVGRGIGDKEKISIIEELAESLGGLMACSRPLVDLGWLSRERQVGASGKSVAPKVYIACGISGASQHLSGMSDSRLIVAINKDPNAPIFQVAHYGVVADLFELVPALTEEAKKVKRKVAS